MSSEHSAAAGTPQAGSSTDAPASTSAERRELTSADLFALQPGFARLMPEIGDRFWKCYYAAHAGNWPLASWQMREMKKLFRLGTFTRPKYGADVDAYMTDMLGPLTAALETEDLASFETHYRRAVTSANEYHDRWKKGYIVWRLPDSPPQDLELSPRPESH